MSKAELGVALVKRACKICHTLVDGELLMNTQLTAPKAKKVEEMHGQCIGWIDSNQYGMCDECLKVSKHGCFLITIDLSKSPDMENPWRTGGIFCIKNAAIKKLFKHDQVNILKYKAAYIDDEIARDLNLPMDYLNGSGSN